MSPDDSMWFFISLSFSETSSLCLAYQEVPGATERQLKGWMLALNWKYEILTPALEGCWGPSPRRMWNTSAVGTSSQLKGRPVAYHFLNKSFIIHGQVENHTNNELSILLSGKWELEFSTQTRKGRQAQACFFELLPGPHIFNSI